MHSSNRATKSLGSIVVTLVGCLCPIVAASAQDLATDPPDIGPARGLAFSPSNIESINPVSGGVGLAIPLAHLPAGPGGFSAGVNLIYNSGIYDVLTSKGNSSSQSVMYYQPSATGGGWSYGYQYTLWAQQRLLPNSNISCSSFTAAEQKTWFKNFLQTPDGNNHLLNLVGVISAGTQGPVPSSIAFDPNNAYVSVDFGGITNVFCGLSTPYQGTLVFATSDSSYIRVEATYGANGTGTWTAYLPNGTKVTGTIGYSGSYAAPSDATGIVDRNGNTLTLGGYCSEGHACTNTIQDAQLRQISIAYTSNYPGTWTDTFTWPGIKGSQALTTYVNWETYTPVNLPYYCFMNLPTSGNQNGSVVTTSHCNLTSNGFPSAQEVTSVQLPAAETGGNSAIFEFLYPASPNNVSWGELHEIVMCTGTGPAPGSPCQAQWDVIYSYQFDTGSASAPPAARPPGTALNPIASKVVNYPDALNGAQLADTTTYQIPVPSSPYAYPVTGTSTVTNPDGSQQQIVTSALCPSGAKSRDFCPPFITEIVSPDGSKTEMAWTWNTAPPSGFSIPSGTVLNPYAQYNVYTNAGATLSKGNYVVQDQNGNTTKLSEYDWVGASAVPRNGGLVTSIPCPTGSAPCPLRTTASTYYATTPYSLHGSTTYFRAPNTVTVSNVVGGSTITAAATNYGYLNDNPLTTANLTSVQQQDSTQGGAFVTTASWTYLCTGTVVNGNCVGNVTNGNVSKSTDGNGVTTQVTYDSSNLYPTQIQIAQGLTEQRTFKPTFDFNSGLKLTETDSDNSVTTTYTGGYDNIGRLKTQTQTGKNSLSRTSTTSYDDINLVVTTTQSDIPGQSLVTTINFDALGRVMRSTDGAGNKVQKAYRYGSGVSYELTSNPYYATTDATMGWTLTTRDSIGRVVSVQSYPGATAPGTGSAQGSLTAPPSYGSTPPTSWGSNTTTTGMAKVAYNVTTSGCSGPTTNSTDEASNTHINCTDGLGRLTAVTEPDLTVTNYVFDMLNNLVGVNTTGQANSTCSISVNGSPAGQTRCFSYSSLSRLLSATNPESGTVTYNTYDNNGNLTKRTDAIGTVTNLTYDGLNRMKTRTYTAAGTTAATPSVCYSYDADYIGALSSVSTSSGGCPATASSNTSSTAYTHDGFGRIVTSSQTMGTGSPYLFSYGYSLTDQLTQMTYPSGRQVSYALDVADRVQTVWNLTAGGNYASSITYTPAGGLSSMTMGNGVTQQLTWNDRQQPLSITAKSPSNTALLTLGLYPCASQATSCATGNNGNLQSQTITMPNLSTLTQSYTFDSLNRLTNASETGGSGWTQSYGYYGSGNMYVSANTNLPPLSSETPQGASWYSASAIPNRINGWGYDLNGNVLQIANTSRSFTYDAENRQVTATINSAGSSYLYDGLGQRVSKTVGGQTTTLVYDAFGELAAEYGSPEASQCGTATCYVTQDHLGSTRLLTDSAGSSNVRRYDYLPFGGELLAGIDGRTNGLGYQTAPDDLDPKFTGKNRDPETGLDWFEVRYLSGAQGRFQSPDPENAGAALGDPQTWNGYAYAGNNPLSYTDPSGEGFFGILGAFFGGIFGGGWGAVIGFAAGNGLDAYIWGPGAISIVGQGSFDLTGCGGPLGGPLGNCGSLGSGPWSENTDLGTVKDPGRFIFSLEAEVELESPSGPGFPGLLFFGPNGKKIGACFVRGAATGAAGTLAVGALSLGAMALAPGAGAVVTGGLLVAGAVGGGYTIYKAGRNFVNRNYAAAAYDVGSVLGSAAIGGSLGGRLGDAITPPASRGWSLARDVRNVYNPSLGTPAQWLATGPDEAAAAGAATAAGSGLAQRLRGLFGGCK